MKRSIKIIGIIAILFMCGCSLVDDCGECFTPPKYFAFELIDNTTHENVFTSGRYDAADIKLKSLADNSSIPFEFIAHDSLNIIEITSIGWQSEIVNYSLHVANDTIFELYADASRVSENCCSFTRWNEIRIDEAEYQLNENTELYTIFVK